MFDLEISGHFSAAHAIVIGGAREALHGHDWHVTVTVRGERLDREGLLVDFHWLEGALRGVIGPFQNANLNEIEPFASGLNPTAEHVARHIGQSLSEQLATRARNGPKERKAPRSANKRGGGVRVYSVRVTEAVGCAATFYTGK